MKNLLADNFDYDTISKQLDLKTVAGKEFTKLALQQCKLMDNKQIDYGSKNISAFGTYGVLVRMSDKIERFKNMKGLSAKETDALRRFIGACKTVEKRQLTISLLEQILYIIDLFDEVKVVFGQKRRKAVNESIQDSFRDLSNYALIAVLLETGKWPND